MSYQLQQGKETLRAGIIYVLVSCAISVQLAIGDASPSETIFIYAVTCTMGIACVWIAFFDRAKNKPSREDLILDMGSIDTFPVAFTMDLVLQYRYEDHKNWTRQEKREVSMVEEAAFVELRRANHPAFADDYKALREAYNSGQFHKAMRYATTKWLKAILLVARSRGDMMADRLLVKHFGLKSRHLPRWARYSI